jgi:MoaA/NifB/PqqE/SkfB family radical SAM enzyme
MEKNALTPTSENAMEVVRFIDDRILGGELTGRTQYYEMIKDFLLGKLSVRNIKCLEMRDGGMIDSNGDYYVCSVSGKHVGNLLNDDDLETKIQSSRQYVRSNYCNSCFHDHASHTPIWRVLKNRFAASD